VCAVLAGPVDRIADSVERGRLEALGPRPLDAEGVRLTGGSENPDIAGEALALVAGDRERSIVGTLDPSHSCMRCRTGCLRR
jgi:hypothetical protein